MVIAFEPREPIIGRAVSQPCIASLITFGSLAAVLAEPRFVVHWRADDAD
jgi:hypothetical protein